MALGDRRLDVRHERIAKRILENPAQSFPKLFPDDAELEGLYRFLNNARLDLNKLLQPHLKETVARTKQLPTVLALHDTTTFTFGGECDRDVGNIGKSAGFLGHFALAVAPGEAREVLGLLGCETIHRTSSAEKPEHWRKRELNPQKQFARWWRMVEATASLVREATSLLHVMDAEGDSYELYSQLVTAQQRFVIRCAHQHRKVGGKHEPLSSVVQRGEVVACRRALLGFRSLKSTRGVSRHSPRPPREAKLEIRACSVELRYSDRRTDVLPSIPLHVVNVYEVDALDGSEAVDWKLYTTEPIDTPEQVLSIVDAYRSRWVIEEYFKALKTGCAYEKRQLESKESLLNALAILAPIACQLLALRNEARVQAVPTALTDRQVRVLRAMSHIPVPKKPTARELMLAVASLGGHIRNNGDPGWQVLGRGFADLLSYERAAVALAGM